MRLDRRSTPGLEKKLAGYTLLGAAAFSISGKAHADNITYVPNVDVTVNSTDTMNYYDFNLSGTLADDITITASGSEIGAYVANGAMIYMDPSDPDNAAALALGALIDPNASPSYWGSPSSSNIGLMLENSGKMSTGDWPINGTDAYLGFYFQGTNGPQAGWADIDTSSNNSATSSFEILSYAYEDDANTPISAGQTTVTPEPSTLTLLALGCAGLLEARRRRLKNA